MPRFRYNPETGELDEISKKVNIKGDVHFPEADSHCGHFFENLNKRVYSKQEKRDVMQKMGVAEL